MGHCGYLKVLMYSYSKDVVKKFINLIKTITLDQFMGKKSKINLFANCTPSMLMAIPTSVLDGLNVDEYHYKSYKDLVNYMDGSSVGCQGLYGDASTTYIYGWEYKSVFERISDIFRDCADTINKDVKLISDEQILNFQMKFIPEEAPMLEYDYLEVYSSEIGKHLDGLKKEKEISRYWDDTNSEESDSEESNIKENKHITDKILIVCDTQIEPKSDNQIEPKSDNTIDNKKKNAT